MFVHHAVADYAVRLVMATSDPETWGMPELAPQIELGASPRATLGLLSAGRALALLRGRRFLVPQDIYDVAPEVLRHRILLTYDALANGVKVDEIIEHILRRTPGPRVAPHQDEAGRIAPLRLGGGTPAPGPRAAVQPTAAVPFARLPRQYRAPANGSRGWREHLSCPVGPSSIRCRQGRRTAPAGAGRDPRLDGLLTGDYLAVAAGPGTEQAGARPYEPGDDARRMDWNLTARALAPYVRTTDADREMETWVVADRSASLDFGTADREKREVVLAAVAAFGFLTARHGNRLGVVVAGGDVTHPDSRSKRPGAAPGRPLGPLRRTPLRREARAPKPTWPPPWHRSRGPSAGGARSSWCPTSSTPPTGRSPPAAWSLRHQMVAVQVTDPRELSLPAVGILGVVDPETGRRLHVQTNSAALRRR